MIINDNIDNAQAKKEKNKIETRTRLERLFISLSQSHWNTDYRFDTEHDSQLRNGNGI